MHFRVFPLAMALLATTFLACPKEEALPTHQGSGTAAEPVTITPVDTATAGTTPTTAPTAAPPPATGAVLATTDGDKPGLTLAVTELKRGSGGTTMLRFTIANGSDSNMDFSYNFIEPGHNGDFQSVGGVHLIDPVAKKKYLVVRDTSSGKCVCSQDLDSIKPGSRTNLWSKFPSPPADVQRVTIIVPHFVPMDDVPIS
jgi:hypothetical protein